VPDSAPHFINQLGFEKLTGKSAAEVFGQSAAATTAAAA